MKFLLIGISFILSFNLYAQDDIPNYKCTVNINPDSILMDNTFLLSFTLEDAQGKFEASPFSDFDVISGPNTSSSVSIINGVSNSKTTYSYYLKPQSPGNFYIQPSSFILENGEMIETEPLEIIVYPNPEGIIVEPKSQQNFPSMSFDWFLGGDNPNMERSIPNQPTPPNPPKPKRKTYKF